MSVSTLWDMHSHGTKFVYIFVFLWLFSEKKTASKMFGKVLSMLPLLVIILMS